MVRHGTARSGEFDGQAALDGLADVVGSNACIVHELDGSFSSEHGIGQLKREQMLQFRPQVEVEMMRRIKQALDPHAILNPGKVL